VTGNLLSGHWPFYLGVRRNLGKKTSASGTTEGNEENDSKLSHIINWRFGGF